MHMAVAGIRGQRGTGPGAALRETDGHGKAVAVHGEISMEERKGREVGARRKRKGWRPCPRAQSRLAPESLTMRAQRGTSARSSAANFSDEPPSTSDRKSVV